jgi:hypothetical protein
MNRAEYIIKTISDANEAGIIDQTNSVRILVEVASLLNSGQDPADIDESPEMNRIWKDVHEVYGRQL